MADKKEAKVKIYTTPACPYCHSAKELLKELGVAFSEIDVSKDQNAADEVLEKSGQTGVPVLDIDGQIIVGFDREKIRQALGKK